MLLPCATFVDTQAAFDASVQHYYTAFICAVARATPRMDAQVPATIRSKT
jgi:hypothetical protein